MSDIVTRLRQDFTTDPIPLHTEAADEIERLRTALEFYANPTGKCDRVPDFYSELDFGSVAQSALDNQQEPIS